MEKNFKKYALKTLILLTFLFVLYAFFDSFIGGIIAFTKLKDANPSTSSLMGGLAFGCAGIFLTLLIAMCVRYFNKNKKVSDLVIFIISSISFVANLIFLIVYFVELSITQIAGSSAFLTYMVVSLIISVCCLIEYIDLYKEETGKDKNEEEKKVEVQKSQTRMKRNILISLVGVIGAVCISLYGLFTGCALNLNYTTYKDKISYLDDSYVNRYSYDNTTNVSVYVNIYFKNIEKSTDFSFKVNYTLNGEQKEALFELKNVHYKDYGRMRPDKLDYVSLKDDELTSEPIVTIDKVSYLENGQYVEIRELEIQKYGVGKKEKAILYCAIATTIVEGIAVVFLALERKRNPKDIR